MAAIHMTDNKPYVRPDATYYFECHITIEPVFDERYKQATEIAKRYSFKIADLLMRKREDTEVRSRNDTFMTGHSKYYLVIEDRMIDCIRALQAEGFKVWRYKIEDTILDSRQSDKLNLIKDTKGA